MACSKSYDLSCNPFVWIGIECIEFKKAWEVIIWDSLKVWVTIAKFLCSSSFSCCFSGIGAAAPTYHPVDEVGELTFPGRRCRYG